MAKYFFHLTDGSAGLFKDEEGEDLPSLEAAQTYAVESAREILSEAALSGKAGGLNQQIEVPDESGAIVLRILVGRAVDTDSQA